MQLELDGKLLALLQKEKLDHHKPNFIKEDCLSLDDLVIALEDCPDVFETLIPLRIPRAKLIRAVTKISEKSKRKEAKVPFVTSEIETKSEVLPPTQPPVTQLTKKEFEKEILLEKEKQKYEIIARAKQILMIQFSQVYVSDPSILLASGCQGELRFDYCYIGLKTAKLLLENDKRFFPSFSNCYFQSGVKLLLGEKFQITVEFKEQQGAPFDYYYQYAKHSPWTGKLYYPMILSATQIDSSVCAFMLKAKANYIAANFSHGAWE